MHLLLKLFRSTLSFCIWQLMGTLHSTITWFDAFNFQINLFNTQFCIQQLADMLHSILNRFMQYKNWYFIFNAQFLYSIQLLICLIFYPIASLDTRLDVLQSMLYSLLQNRSFSRSSIPYTLSKMISIGWLFCLFPCTETPWRCQ